MANHESRTTNHGTITCPAVILCGGLGLRLRPAIQDKPKCLAPIGGRPFLEWLLGSLQRQGCAKVILCLGYGSEHVLEFLERRETRDERQGPPDSEFRIPNSGYGPRMEIRYVLEQQPLGTGGALRNAAPLIQADHFLAMNGDTIFDVDLEELLRSHVRRDALATIAVRRNPAETARYGGVTVDPDGRIVRFSEKGVDNDLIRRPPHPARVTRHPLPQGGEEQSIRERAQGGGEAAIDNHEERQNSRAKNQQGNVGQPPTPNPQPPLPVSGITSTGAGKDAGPTFINGGVYAFAKEIFEVISGPPEPSSLEKDVFPSIVGQRFYGFPGDGYFLDIGIPEDYQKAQTELPQRLMPW